MLRAAWSSFVPFVLCCLLTTSALAQPAPEWSSPLTVRQIMQDPDTWVGDWPEDVRWGEQGEYLYFAWNPQGWFASDSLYRVPRGGGEPEQVTPEARRQLGPFFDGWHHGEHVYTRNFGRKVYTDEGDVFVYDRRGDTRTRLTETLADESDPRFTADQRAVVYTRDGNLFRHDLGTGTITQLTDLRSGSEPADETTTDQQDFLEDQQQTLFEVIRREQEEREAREAAQEREAAARNLPPTFYTGERSAWQLELQPGGRFVTFELFESADADETLALDYVTESGYAETLEARPKVGAPGNSYGFFVQDLERDTTYEVDLHQLPGAYDVPAFLQEQGVERDSSAARRNLRVYGPYWSADGRYAVLDVRSRDNKDRWIARLHPETGTLTPLDRQHDEAWIAGPGVSWYGGRSDVGWMPGTSRFFFQSEADGYSHLYTVDAESGDVEQLTEGSFEVFDPRLSRDGRTWYFTSSEGSPYQRHFYRMPVEGGRRERLTTMEGNNQAVLAPDGEMMGVLFSYTDQPPEVYLQAPNGEPRRVTHSPSEAWLAYDWKVPETITFEASDRVEVPAHVFRPENPNGAAVLFVHGAGYLQNVHGWWSSYFREYMFHNLLADLGYTVMNVDYRGSAGYGRDWRTAVYRHMGGRDLQDYVDASQYLGAEHGIPSERVFIYGGSYGGFITLMALFTEPEHFGGGAALRAVTDWAHYNHTYTANILNTPAGDSLAYARSSPIYFAEGLEDPLLIAHGVVDTNVQFQDVVRLAQRLIELGKEDWEMALYPVEGHGFTEPESWADEYRRILELVKLSVGPPEQAREVVPVLDAESGR